MQHSFTVMRNEKMKGDCCRTGPFEDSFCFLSVRRVDQVNQFPLALAVLCQQLCILRGNSMMSEGILDGLKASGVGLD